MINFTLNGGKHQYDGDMNQSLLSYLRLDQHLTAVKDGCSGEAASRACTVEVNGKAVLSCVTKMQRLDGVEVFTPEGFPKYVLDTIA